MEETRRLLVTEGRAMTIAEITRRLPPNHDLESLALWLTMALEAELPIAGEVGLDAEAVAGIELDL